MKTNPAVKEEKNQSAALLYSIRLSRFSLQNPFFVVYCKNLMEESVFSQSPFATDASTSSKGPSSGRGKKILFLIILLVILGSVAFGAVKFLGKSSTNATPTPTPTIAMVPTDTPTASPSAAVSGTPTPTKKAGTTPTVSPKVTGTTGTTDRSKYTVTVQNGSGITGAAKKMGDFLTGLGYTVSSVGNAPTSDYTQTEVHVKAADKDFLPTIKKDLSANYTVGTAAADNTGSTDILVIVGKE
ncbi:MAG: LytR C-terminal domain-containing protein [Candidatus Levyibacteriota bacterium]